MKSCHKPKLNILQNFRYINPMNSTWSQLEASMKAKHRNNCQLALVDVDKKAKENKTRSHCQLSRQHQGFTLELLDCNCSSCCRHKTYHTNQLRCQVGFELVFLGHSLVYLCYYSVWKHAEHVYAALLAERSNDQGSQSSSKVLFAEQPFDKSQLLCGFFLHLKF